jgi:hypothetical protein
MYCVPVFCLRDAVLPRNATLSLANLSVAYRYSRIKNEINTTSIVPTLLLASMLIVPPILLSVSLARTSRMRVSQTNVNFSERP